MIVGGIALAFHGRPRFTGDIDVFVRPERENAEKAAACVAEFGFASLKVAAEDLSQPDRVIQLGFPPGRIDLLTSIDGVSFEDAWASRQSGDFGGEPAWFIDLPALIRNKRASGRPQDIADLDALGVL